MAKYPAALPVSVFQASDEPPLFIERRKAGKKAERFVFHIHKAPLSVDTDPRILPSVVPVALETLPGLLLGWVTGVH